MKGKTLSVVLDDELLNFLTSRKQILGIPFAATVRLALKLLKKKEGVPHESRNL